MSLPGARPAQQSLTDIPPNCPACLPKPSHQGGHLHPGEQAGTKPQHKGGRYTSPRDTAEIPGLPRLGRCPGCQPPGAPSQPDWGGRCPQATPPSSLTPTEHLALEGRNKLPGPSTHPRARTVGSHSLGVTQSLMYAFSRACMVFTTAKSSAMLSYLRRTCPSDDGHQGF